MDASVFLDDSFEPDVWVNQILQDRETVSKDDESESKYGTSRSEGLESYITMLNMKLQLMAQDFNTELEKNMMEILGSIPRAIIEVDQMEGSVQSLKKDVTTVTGQLQGIDGGSGMSNNNETVEILSQLNILKKNMEICRSTLMEAANWNQLVRDINAVFAKGDPAEIAEKLQAMRYSLKVLESMPEAIERTNTMKDLENQLEVILKPKLSQAIQKEIVTSLQEYVQLYKKLDRLEALQKEYTKARPSQVHRYWFTFSQHDQFLQWIPSYYDQVLDLVSDEKRRCIDIFGSEESPTVLLNLVVDTFEPLIVSYHGRLKDYTKFSDIVNVFEENIKFLTRVCEYLDGINHEQLLHINKVVNEPFRDYHLKYESLEEQSIQEYMDEELVKLKSIIESIDISSFPSQLQEILDRSENVFEVTTNCVKRSLNFSAGLHFKELMSIVSKLLSWHITCLTGLFDPIRTHCGLNKFKDISSLSSPKGSTSSTSTTTTSSSNFDWDFLRGAFFLLQISGRWHRRLSLFEKDLIKKFKDKYSELYENKLSTKIKEQYSKRNIITSQNLVTLWSESLLAENPTKRADLQSFLRTCAGCVLPGEVLKTPFRKSNQFSSEARHLIFDLCMGLVRDKLYNISELAVWLNIDGPKDQYSSYQYNILPQQFITQVGEHLLSLMQQIENFAQSEALTDVMVVATGLDRLGENEWKRIGVDLELNELEMSSLMKMMLDIDLEDILHLDKDEYGDEEEEEEGDENKEKNHHDDENTKEMQQFCNEWLFCLARSMVGIFLSEILKISKFTEKGFEQLKVDIGYVLQIISFLSKKPHSIVRYLHKLCNYNHKELQSILQENMNMNNNNNNEVLSIVKKIENKIIAAYIS